MGDWTVSSVGQPGPYIYRASSPWWVGMLPENWWKTPEEDHITIINEADQELLVYVSPDPSAQQLELVNETRTAGVDAGKTGVVAGKGSITQEQVWKSERNKIPQPIKMLAASKSKRPKKVYMRSAAYVTVLMKHDAQNFKIIHQNRQVPQNHTFQIMEEHLECEDYTFIRADAVPKNFAE